MLRIFLQLLQVIKKFDVMEGFSSAEDKSEWYSRLSRAEAYVPLLKNILPFLTTFFPNVQFIEAGSTTAPELGTEPSIPDIQEATDKPKRSRRKSSVEQ